ncbi:hypothetical protein FOWG_14966 [Fusarium oxysporum f. sp. lycopersici MN25]|nr:hypothetical protein FOWG_14966 [Fusarium oxysporum f. sp. lycopersici MN25]
MSVRRRVSHMQRLSQSQYSMHNCRSIGPKTLHSRFKMTLYSLVKQLLVESHIHRTLVVFYSQGFIQRRIGYSRVHQGR